ncbi:hypothetical protein BDQ12DRAFT_320095 [Crucibulum laeve]|uniref:Peptide hydrolase n=1 Tax=Crucibulum laeve TaxID=68775 RepID=A0A5C3LRC9_9AGAR|nr:hypothetical protein BDQ12DRAFT_320095 [Crucibulum laeve]
MKFTIIAIFSASIGLTIASPNGDGGGGHNSGHGKPSKPLPLVTSTELRRTISSRALLDHANKFVGFSKLSDGTRAFGSKGHNASVDYIKKSLDKTGYYDTQLQTFSYLFSEGTAQFSAGGVSYTTGWFTYGPAGLVEAPIVVVNDLGCVLEDYPATVVGSIALIKRGSCEFGLKVALAGAAGAAGAIIYNNVDGAVTGGTLSQITRPDVGPYVPIGSISGVDGNALVTRISAGELVIGNLDVDAVNEDRFTSNVLATSKGGDKNNLVFAGGHTDSVPAGPGINDDGSGTIGLLEIALQLPKWSVKNAVRFGFWTAEEYGLVGSEHYVASLSEAERAKVALYLNFDMIASPNYGYFIYDGDGSAFNLTGPPGSEHIEKVFEDYFKSQKITSGPTQFNGRSDYGPFLDVGIPAGGLFTGAEGVKTAEQAAWWGGQADVAYDVCYHKGCDGISNLNVKAFVENTKAAAHSIATYARSLAGIPRAAGKREVVTREQLPHDQRRHQACGHELPAL